MQTKLLQPNPFLVAGFLLCGLAANVGVWKMVAEVNARLPEAGKFSWLWWTWGKYMRLWREHKRLCPESHWRGFSGACSLRGNSLDVSDCVSRSEGGHVK